MTQIPQTGGRGGDAHTPRKRIHRVALLQDYTGRSERLLPLVDEAARKGYSMVGFFLRRTEVEEFRRLAAHAHSLGLGVSVFTGYMKYEQRYLSEHPEQALFAADGSPFDDMACPFNPAFRERYFDYLRELASTLGVTRLSVNDEAYLGNACYCEVCREDFRRQFGEEVPCKPEPQGQDWLDPRWRRYLKWKIDRWTTVHGDMARVIHEINPNLQVTFQSSPYVDLWANPWFTGVDLAAMAEQLDGLSTDPYYTFHDAPFFQPPEVYLGEWSRFIAGLVPEGKSAEIVPQGFSHPTFSRPLGESDGLWASLIPPACGVDMVTPYTYTLQRCSPMQEAYERCFGLDRYFEQVKPLRYAAVVHSVSTEVYRHPLPMLSPCSYDGTRVLPVTQSLRHRGLPYGWVPEARLHDVADPDSYPVVVLPEVSCLSEDGASSLNQRIKSGGNLVILGQLGDCDEIGNRRETSVLEHLAGISVTEGTQETRQFRLLRDLPEVEEVWFVNPETAERYWEGTYRPLRALTHCVDADLPADAEVLAEFVTDEGEPTGKPAVALLHRVGRLLWLAGFPSRTAPNPKSGLAVRNEAHDLLPCFVELAAGGKPALRVVGWPPPVPMRELRPVDPRYMSTFEFFPLIGEDYWMGVVTSYFREPAEFTMALDLPAGKRLVSVIEALSGQDVPFAVEDRQAKIRVAMGFDTAALVFLFQLQ